MKQGTSRDDPVPPVGTSIEVYWPDDDQYYTGTVESFDVDTLLHQIAYDDGDVEHLNMVNEVYRVLSSSLMPKKALVALQKERKVAPWKEQMLEVWKRRMPEATLLEINDVVEVLSSSLTDNTYSNYDSKAKMFVDFCRIRGIQYLPASTNSVIRYLAWHRGRVHSDGTPRVKSSSLQPYLSAINRLHIDLGFDPPAQGDTVTKFRHGMGYLEAEDHCEAARVPIPAEVVLKMLQFATNLSSQKGWYLDRQRLLQFRACFFQVLTFCWFCRGDTGYSALHEDVVLSSLGITLVNRKAKGRGHKRVKKTLQIPAGAVAGVEELLQRWLLVRKTQKCAASGFSFWHLPFEARTTKQVFVDTNLALALGLVGVSPPPGHLWLPHSLRGGAATSAHSIGIGLPKICYFGDWSITSSAIHDYIDPSTPSSAAARHFFGWLLG